MSVSSAAWRQIVARVRHRVQRALLARLPARLLAPMAAFAWVAGSGISARFRANGRVRMEIGRELIGLSERAARPARYAAVLEQLIDRRIYFGRSRDCAETWTDLQAIAASLARAVEQLRAQTGGRPVIVAPFHYVSQYASIYVVETLGAMLGIASLAVVSGVPRDQYGDDHILIPGLRVLYTYGDGNRNGLGLRVARALKRDGVAILFADVPPFALQRYPMETVGVTLFERDARIHNGVFRMGAPLRASLLSFYLRFESGRFYSHAFEPLALDDPNAPQRLANDIETALKQNYPQWLPAGHPAMYSFAPLR